MSEYWEAIYHRGQQSIGVWNAFAAAFAFGEVTKASHTTDVTGLQTKANERDVQQDVVDVARDVRDANLRFMEDLCIRFPRKLEGDLTPTDLLHQEIADLRSINPDGPDTIAARTRRTISLWNRINAQRAAAVPPLPAFQVGAAVVADLGTALANQNTLMQSVEDERGKLAVKREALRALATKVDDNNKRWFAAWEGEFAANSAERAALSQIDTGGQTPAPEALEINTAEVVAPNQVAVTYVADGGDNATSFKLKWKIETVDADFVHEAVLNLAGQTVTVAGASGKTVSFKAVATNSTASTDSAVKQVTMP
jgi:hypothetical protein